MLSRGRAAIIHLTCQVITLCDTPLVVQEELVIRISTTTGDRTLTERASAMREVNQREEVVAKATDSPWRLSMLLTGWSTRIKTMQRILQTRTSLSMVERKSQILIKKLHR